MDEHGVRRQVSTDPDELMRSAALDALERVHGVFWHMDIRSLYGPLVETLTWITALAELMGKKEEPRYSAYAHARNRALHGARIVSEIDEAKGPTTSLRFRGQSASVILGRNTTRREWGFVADPDPPGETRWPKRRADYASELSLRVVLPTLDAALLDLGVNIWLLREGGRSPLLPERTFRSASCPPGWIPPHD